METWPATLPQAFLQSSYKETDKDMVISFKTDVGPPMTRLRYESNLLPFSGDMLMTASQKATHRTFWEANCAVPFSFPDPDTGSNVSVKYTAPPEYTFVTKSGGVKIWRVTLQLAKVP